MVEGEGLGHLHLVVQVATGYRLHLAVYLVTDNAGGLGVVPFLAIDGVRGEVQEQGPLTGMQGIEVGLALPRRVELPVILVVVGRDVALKPLQRALHMLGDQALVLDGLEEIVADLVEQHVLDVSQRESVNHLALLQIWRMPSSSSRT